MKGSLLNKWDALMVYLAVIPWAFMAMFLYLDVSKWIEMLFVNLELVIITPVFISYSVIKQRKAGKGFENCKLPIKETFEQNLSKYGFSLREIEIIRLLKIGYTKKQVSDKLFIALSTLSRHVQNIHDKAEVNNRLALMNKLELYCD